VTGTRLLHLFRHSPNHEPRPKAVQPRYLILHYTGMATAEQACAWLCAPESKVSCHYLIDEAGEITQMVSEAQRAWHAGVSSWHDDKDINALSIGIEIQNAGHSADYPDFPPAQMAAVAALAQDVATRHGIAPHHILAHSDIAPGRKIDPGEKFDWRYLHEKGVGHWVEAEPVSGGVFLQRGDQGDSVLALQSLLKMYGYGIEQNGKYGARTQVVVEAFQRHFRPQRVDGVADHSTVATLRKLLDAVPARVA
jgi:N-acetylmuramoyl-L-alanine amidase